MAEQLSSDRAATYRSLQHMILLVRGDPELYASALDIVKGDTKMLALVFIGLGTMVASISAQANRTSCHATDAFEATLLQLVIQPALRTYSGDMNEFQLGITKLLDRINQRLHAGDPA